MSTSELVKTQHVERKAVIYIRQSSPHQVVTNKESLRLQYALKQRATELGWNERNVEIIDCDLGITGSSTAKRVGFKDLVAKVTLGHIGIVLSYEVTRLSRNCSDWYQLLDVCGFRDCLIGDRDGVYDPGTPNGRLLLGLKGQISEMELHTIKGRLTAGLLNKAKRGELAMRLPVGLVRDKHGIVSKHANVEIQRRIDLIFETFLRVKSASRTLKHFIDHSLTLPRQDNFGDIIWKKPSIAAILTTLKNPAYAGRFAYGQSGIDKRAGAEKSSRRRLPVDQWKVMVEDKYPAYVNQETFDKIQSMLRDNYAEYDRNKTRGIPRPGKALLHGIVFCGECGHKMLVQYKGGTRYLCNALRQQFRVPVCQYILADPIDDHVVNAFFEVLSPAELDLYAKAMESKKYTDEKVVKSRLQQLERLRYQARFAERQFHQVDPDNRLVAAELERRWEAALIEMKAAESEMEREDQLAEVPALITQKIKKAFENVGAKLPEVWKQDILSQQQRKSLLRCLIDKVVIHRIARDTIKTRIVWKGGATSTADIRVTVGSIAHLTGAKAMEDTIIKMATAGRKDAEIAAMLTKNGHRSPHSHTVIPSTVKFIRLKHKILVTRHQAHPRNIPGRLTVSQLARAVDVSAHWIYDRIHNGTIAVARDAATNLYLFPDKPSTIKQFTDLKNKKLQNLRY